MKRINFLLICLGIISLSACVNETGTLGKPITKFSVEEIRNATKVEKTSFDSHTKLSGKKGSLNVFGEVSLSWFLRSWVAEGSKPEHQLYVDIRYSTSDNWRFYDRAQSTDAQSVKVTKIDSDVSCRASSYGVSCTYYETVGINLTHDFLLSKKNSGFTIRLLAKKGNMVIINVPANYTQGYVQSLLPTMQTAGLDVSDLSEENNQSSVAVIPDTYSDSDSGLRLIANTPVSVKSSMAAYALGPTKPINSLEKIAGLYIAEGIDINGKKYNMAVHLGAESSAAGTIRWVEKGGFGKIGKGDYQGQTSLVDGEMQVIWGEQPPFFYKLHSSGKLSAIWRKDQSSFEVLTPSNLDASDSSEENNQSSNGDPSNNQITAAPKLPEHHNDKKTISALCNMATKKDANGQLVWDEGKAFESTVAMLKKEQIDCGVVETTDTVITSQKTSEENLSNNTSSDASMSLSTAKAECTSLGFSAGTEKYGDCVMKLMGD